MDGFTEMMLAETGLIAMIGKAERGPVAIEAIKKHKSAYLMAVGGAADWPWWPAAGSSPGWH